MAHQQLTMMRTTSTSSSRAAHCCCATHTHHKHRHAVKCQAVPTQELAQLAPHLLVLQDAQLAAAAALQSAADLQAGAVATAADAAVSPSAYVPGPVEVGWQIWFAAAVSTIPFVIGAYEFGKRILIQRRCKVCGGSGLVQRGKFQRKCPECGGFFPWVSWSMFLSANARPGNGGPLLQPRGQTNALYKVPPAADGQQPATAKSQSAGQESAQQEQPRAVKEQRQQDS